MKNIKFTKKKQLNDIIVSMEYYPEYVHKQILIDLLKLGVSLSALFWLQSNYNPNKL